MIEVNYYIVKVGLFDKNENLLETFETYGLRFEETKTLALKNCEAEKDNSSNEFCKLVFWDIETAH
jgi:hypothetical protein